MEERRAKKGGKVNRIIRFIHCESEVEAELRAAKEPGAPDQALLEEEFPEEIPDEALVEDKEEDSTEEEENWR